MVRTGEVRWMVFGCVCEESEGRAEEGEKQRREVVAVIGGCIGDGDWFHGGRGKRKRAGGVADRSSGGGYRRPVMDGSYRSGRIMVGSMKNNESGLNPNPDLALASRDYICDKGLKQKRSIQSQRKYNIGKSACLKIGVFEDVRRSVLNPLVEDFAVRGQFLTSSPKI
ncbi:hypothetical protein L2E82_04754 [Cichorium intybus]|uniref:Uncharacterized protein n=1 Tax=Cichorium intybus TaxID=13427 RepID=A0ACB9H6T3_CICIN|nr:hypothetical protein L2E82_04754 [Cichorium intybus]